MGGLPQRSFLFDRSNDAIALISLSLVQAALSDRQRLPILLSRSLALTHLNGQTDNTCNTCVPPFSKHTCLLLLLKRSQRRRTNNKKKKGERRLTFSPPNQYLLPSSTFEGPAEKGHLCSLTFPLPFSPSIVGRKVVPILGRKYHFLLPPSFFSLSFSPCFECIMWWVPGEEGEIV